MRESAIGITSLVRVRTIRACYEAHIIRRRQNVFHDGEPHRYERWTPAFCAVRRRFLRRSLKVDSALVLSGFLSDKAPHLNLIVHRDADYISVAGSAAFAAALTKGGARPFLTKCSDVENYFLNAEHLSYLNPGLSVERVRELIEIATERTADKSIRSIVNARTAEAFAERRKTGQPPDYGAIAVQAQKDYESAPNEMRRGKIVCGELAALIQQEIKAHARIFHASPHLGVPELAALAREAWPSPGSERSQEPVPSSARLADAAMVVQPPS